MISILQNIQKRFILLKSFKSLRFKINKVWLNLEINLKKNI